MIDAHCHLAFKGLVEIVDEVLNEAKNSMKFVVTSGLTRDYEKTLEIAKKNEGFVFTSLGVHPEDIVEMNDNDIQKSLDFIQNNADNIVAVGEIGLDYKWVQNEKQNEKCKKIFEKSLDIAEEFNMPIVLHSRKAEEDVFDIVSQRKFRNVVFHHYSGNVTLAQKIIEKGYYISIPTTIATSKNLRKIGKSFNLQHLLTETDSPFNSPIEGKPNVPQNVSYTLKLLSELRNEPISKIEHSIDENGTKIFIS